MLGEPQACSLKYLADKKFQLKTVGYPEGETMLFPCRSAPTIPSPPSLTLPRSKARTFNILEVVFSTTGDLIKVHSYGDPCSATWDTALTYGRLESEGGNGTVVAIRPDERAWLDRIRTLAAEWLAAVEAADRSWIAQAANRIQRYDDRSDGLIDLVVVWPVERQWSPK